MAGIVSEVRAKFSATAQGLLSSVREMREDMQKFGTQSEDAVRDVNRELNKFGSEAVDAGHDINKAMKNAADGADDLERQMKNVSSGIQNTEGFARSLMKQLTGFAAVYLGFDALASGVMNVGKAMIMGNADMETYQNTLATVLKSSEKATDMLAWAEQFAASTPFEIPDIVEATTKLETYGISAKATMTDIGNMAAITGKPLMQAIEAVADAQTGELERLKEFGITKQMLIEKAAELGKGEIVNAQGQVTDMAALNESLFAIMKERYDGGMELASTSFKGLMSNVQDGLGTMTRELSKPLFEKFKSGLQSVVPIVSAVTSFIKGNSLDAFNTLKDAFGEDKAHAIMQFFGKIKEGVGDLKSWIQSFTPTIKNIGTVFSNLMPVIAPIFGAIVIAFQNVASAIPPILEYVTDLAAKFSEWEGFVPLVSGLVASFVTYKTTIAAIQKAQLAYNAIQKASAVLMGAYNAAVVAFNLAGGGMTGVMAAMKAGMAALNITFLANPIVLIVAALVGLGVALYVAYQKSETFRNAVDKAWAAIKDGFQSVINWFTVTLPAWIQSVIAWFTNFGTSVSTFFSNLWTVIVNGVMGFVNGVVAWFTNLYTTVSGIVMTFVGYIQQGFSNLVNNVKFIIEPFINFFVQSWENLKNLVLGIIGVFVAIFTGDFEALKNALLLIWQTIKDQISLYIETIKETALRIFQVMKSGLTNIFNALKDAALNVWNALKNGVINAANSLKDGAVNTWNALKNAVIDAANALKDGAVNAWNALKSWVSSTVSNIKSDVTNGFNGAKDAAVNAFNNLVSGVREKISDVKNKVSEMKDNIISTARNIDLTEIGKDIVRGLVKGLGSMLGELKNKAKEIADTVKQAIADKLKIKSPSRVMMGFGVNVGEGLRNGISSMVRKVGSVAGDMANAVTDNMGFGGAISGALNTSATLNTITTLKHVIDLVNVPDGIDEKTLLTALLNVFKDPQIKRKIDRINAENNFGFNRPKGVM